MNEQKQPPLAKPAESTSGEGFNLLCSVAKVQSKVLSNVIHCSPLEKRPERSIVCSTSDWDETHEALIKSWRKQACINIWLQQASSYYYERISVLTTYPCIFSSAFSATCIFVSNHPAVRFVIAGLSLASCVLLATNRHSRAPEKAAQYSSTARDYASFIRYINFVSILAEVQKPPVKETISKLRADFDKINETQLDPPLYIIRAYEQNHKSIEASLYEDLVAERRIDFMASSSDDSV
jgi:hypothetical protein